MTSLPILSSPLPVVICELQHVETMPIYAVAGAILPYIPSKSD